MMTVNRIWIWAVALAMLPCAASAQFDFGGGDSGKPAWDSFKLNPKTRIKLDFRNANVDSVLALYQKTSGVTIVKDPALTGAITVTSATAVSLSDAFAILNATLSLKSFEMKKEGNLLVIRSRQRSPQQNFDMSAFAQMGQQSSGQLKVYQLEFANATQVARVLNEVFQNSTNPMDQILQQFGNQGGGGGRFGGNQGGGRFGGGGTGGGRFGGFGRSTPTVRASADDFSNSVIVNAPDKEQGQVRDLIKQLDKQTDQPQKAKVFKLTYAVAADLAPVVQNVLVSNAPRGRGGISTQNVPIEQRFQQAFRLGGTQAAFGTVVADDRTNSLVVTATDENLGLVSEVIKELDTEIKMQTTTFVFPLANARADQVAQLLSQAFGTRQTSNGARTGANTTTGFNRNNTNNRNNNNRTGGGGGGGGGGFGGGGLQSQTDPQNLNLDMAVPKAESGELATHVDVDQSELMAQVFGGQFGGARQQSQQTGQTTGRDQQGRIVNVRDLTGQVTTIADPNTNSIIIVTTPENAEMIKSILDQLDKIPEQVLIETIIVEATLDASSKLGVEWNYNRANFQDGQTGNVGSTFGLQNQNPALQGLRYTLTGGTLSGFINALATDKKFQVLSTPRIFTSNNVQAQINISQSVPYVLSTREDTNGNLTFNYAFQDVGIVLTVTPHIASNGIVTMDVDQTANDLQGFTSFNAPIVNQRQATTTVSVKDGETVILGGIIRSSVTSTVNKIPILGDIPLLGNLFKTTDKDKVKTELLVFLTPRIVKGPEEAQKLKDEQLKQLSPQTQRQLKQTDPPQKDGKSNEGKNK
ncbi:MAG: hypothetical protein JSS66_14195 [Armatimonadetes bacterium]|nr:hypothetical protein [Armatimonadota bacterium]